MSQTLGHKYNISLQDYPTPSQPRHMKIVFSMAIHQNVWN